ncbi:hypothetical protein ACQKPE_16090 [Pseudomonas sp. NPDC089554]|uniref:hypothetical protein n=1 Tax=Pseudomonas sp. NPDC089554 TaxID=3390653 RepID=UPI003CFBD7C4
MSKWLQREVALGLKGLIALRLDGAPSVDTVSATLEVWLLALNKGREWDEVEDAVRIQKAFEVLFATCERWPPPARLMRELPARTPGVALPKPKRTDEQIKTGNAALDEIIAARRRGAMANLAPKTDRQIDAARQEAEALFTELRNRASTSTDMEQHNR